MKKITTPCKPDYKKQIFSEGLNYFATGKKSIWGSGDKETLKFLKKEKIRGKWLNLAAGDGRYNLKLLRKAGFVIASDIDKSALSKLYQGTPKEYLPKLRIKVFDITKRFPFKDSSFDGIFSAGVLHLFSTQILKKIVHEMDRTLNAKGKVLIDFATDIKRVSKNGELIVFESEPQYKLNEAKKLLKTAFKKYRVKIHELRVFEEEFKAVDKQYNFSCKGFLLVAEKN
ncbi:MAG: class I SAM-dependent methyltransferase [Candidatus Diapherotrites archaeon]|nr:class I SAM-dependent methyltransferase [Candidatus Diapherotrites archaeon]